MLGLFSLTASYIDGCSSPRYSQAISTGIRHWRYRAFSIHMPLFFHSCSGQLVQYARNVLSAGQRNFFAFNPIHRCLSLAPWLRQPFLCHSSLLITAAPHGCRKNHWLYCTFFPANSKKVPASYINQWRRHEVNYSKYWYRICRCGR